MASILDAVRGVAKGVDEASGNQAAANDIDQQFAREREKQQQQLQFQIAPYALNVRNLQNKLQTVQPDSPEYHQIVDQIQGNVHSMREILHPDWKPGPSEWLKTHLTDRLHISNANKRAAQQNTEAMRNQNWEQAETQAQAGAVTPWNQTPQYLSAQALENQRVAAAQKLEDERAQSALAVEKLRESGKPPKGMKLIGTDAFPLGFQNQDTGQQYLPNQLGLNGDAPPEYKEAWKTLQDAKIAAQKQKDAKEDEAAERQARTIAAGFERMGRTEEFQEQMAQYRSDLAEHRALDTAAQNSSAMVQSLKDQYAQPGNHAVADNELQNFYTTVVQKGGRKTAAELKLTTQIGGLGMNLETMATKAAKGELPDELRLALLKGMDSISKEQQKEADQIKPELPQIPGVRQGPKTNELKKTRQQQAGNRVRVRLSNGQTGTIDASDFDPATMTKVQ